MEFTVVVLDKANTTAVSLVHFRLTVLYQFMYPWMKTAEKLGGSKSTFAL